MDLGLYPTQFSTPRAEPKSVYLLGTPLLVSDHASLLELLGFWSQRSKTTVVDFSNTQIVTMRRIDPSFIQATSQIDYFVPDGMPLIWCLRAMGTSIPDRIYGPTFMRYALCHETKLRHYFLGGSEETLRKLCEEARKLSGEKFQIVGTRHGYFKPADNPAIVEEINRLSPDVIWIGLGTPKQQQWVHDHRQQLQRGVVLNVGFAFDVNAGTKRDAPMWMQKLGITWIFRISQEPSRLLSRYLKYNTWFVLLILGDLVRFTLRTGKRIFRLFQ